MPQSTDSSVSSEGISLAIRLRTGSAGAWREFVHLYGPLLDHWCRVGNVPADAIADVAQDVLMSAFRGVDKFDESHKDATFRG